MTLEGPSRTIVVEPLERPEPVPAPPPAAPERSPERPVTPEPAAPTPA